MDNYTVIIRNPEKVTEFFIHADNNNYLNELIKRICASNIYENEDKRQLISFTTKSLFHNYEVNEIDLSFFMINLHPDIIYRHFGSSDELSKKDIKIEKKVKKEIETYIKNIKEIYEEKYADVYPFPILPQAHIINSEWYLPKFLKEKINTYINGITIVENILKYRIKELGITQAAKLTGEKWPTISQFIDGKRKFSLNKISELSEKLF